MRGKGEGSVFRRKDGLWCAIIELPPKGGDRRRKTVTSKDKKVVLQKMRALHAELDRAGDLTTTSPTLEQWFTYWLPNVAAKKVRPLTLDNYRSLATVHILPELGHVRLDKLTPQHVRRLHHAMSETSSTYHQRNGHELLSGALKDAVREGRAPRNVADLVDAPKISPTPLHALTVDQAINVISKCVDAFNATPYDPTPALWAAYLLTGTRRCELIGLERDRVGDMLDMSWQMQELRVNTPHPAGFETRHVTGAMWWTRPKTKKGWRVIPLVEPLRTILTEHMARTPDKYGLVFVRPDGEPYRPAQMSKLWAAQAPQFTDEKVRLHDLRHTTVDLLYEAGIDEAVIQEMLGHSVRSVTRGYRSKNPKMLTEAMRQLSAYIAR